MCVIGYIYNNSFSKISFQKENSFSKIINNLKQLNILNIVTVLVAVLFIYFFVEIEVLFIYMKWMEYGVQYLLFFSFGSQENFVRLNSILEGELLLVQTNVQVAGRSIIEIFLCFLVFLGLIIVLNFQK